MLPRFHIIQTRKYYYSIWPDIRFHSIPITSVIWDAINLVGEDDEQVNMSINAASSSYAMLLLHNCTLRTVSLMCVSTSVQAIHVTYITYLDVSTDKSLKPDLKEH